MAKLVERIVSVLDRQPDAAAVDEAMLNAAFLFEKARGLSPCAWPEEVIDYAPSREDVGRLRDAVVAYVERNGVGAWTLGKCYDAAVKPILVSVVRRRLNDDPGELFQAMVALDNLGEPVFGDARSRSILDEETNRALARRYLAGIEGGDLAG